MRGIIQECLSNGSDHRLQKRASYLKVPAVETEKEHVVNTDPPKTDGPDKQSSHPIPSGNAFIGLCATRAAALQLFDKRVFQIFATNLGGLIAAVLWLATVPPWYLLFVFAIGVLVFLVLLRLSIRIFRGSADRVTYWTETLSEHERVNGTEGAIRMFSSSEYELLQQTPALPVTYLIWIVRTSMVIWAVVLCTAVTMSLYERGVPLWIWQHWRVSCF